MEYFGTGILYVASAGRSYPVEPDEKHLRSCYCSYLPRCHVVQYAVDAFAEICRWRNQAHDQISIGGKLVAWCGMHADAGSLDEVDRKILIAIRDCAARHGLPTAIRLQNGNGQLA